MIDAFRRARSPEELEQAIAAARTGASPSLARMLDELGLRARLSAFVRGAGADSDTIEQVQRIVERTVARLVDGWPAQRWSPWTPAESPPAPLPEEPREFGEPAHELRGIQLTDERTLLFDEGTHFVERRLDGTRVREIAARGCELVGFAGGCALARGCMSSGEVVGVREKAIQATRASYQAVGLPTDGIEDQFADFPDEGESIEDTLFALELHSGRWRAPPASAWIELESFTELPRLRRTDGATALLLCDQGAAVQSRDLGLLWIDTRIVEAAELGEVGAAPRALGSARAVGRASDGRFVTRDLDARFVCLDRESRLLAAVLDDTVRIERADEGTTVAEFRLE